MPETLSERRQLPFEIDDQIDLVSSPRMPGCRW